MIRLLRVGYFDPFACIVSAVAYSDMSSVPSLSELAALKAFSVMPNLAASFMSTVPSLSGFAASKALSLCASVTSAAKP